MGRSGFFCKEEGQDPSTVHRLLIVEHGNNQESVSLIED